MLFPAGENFLMVFQVLHGLAECVVLATPWSPFLVVLWLTLDGSLAAPASGNEIEKAEVVSGVIINCLY